ncbi:hypothetical protein MP228_011749 [Amoeboaphelidium protococcarum]|nr:hypothetical protein MP228_011749 [Amoeboaphelidium protococcarum]
MTRSNTSSQKFRQCSNPQTGTFLQCKARQGLESVSCTSKLSQAARKDKNDSKSRQHLASYGKQIPITDYEHLGVIALDQTSHYQALTVFNIEECQTRLLLAMMLNGPCYRFGEWMQMILGRTEVNGNTINIVVPTTKNTLRQGQSAMLKIPLLVYLNS